MTFQYTVHPADTDKNRLKQRLRGFADAILGSYPGNRDELGTITSGLKAAYREGYEKGAKADRLYISELAIGTEVIDLFDGRLGVVADLFEEEDAGTKMEMATIQYADGLTPSDQDLPLAYGFSTDLSLAEETVTAPVIPGERHAPSP